MTRSFWIQVGIFAAIALIAVAVLFEPRYPVVRDAQGESFTVLSEQHVISTGGHWTLFKYVARAEDRSAIVAEEVRLVHEVAGNLADQNGDTLLVVQAVFQRYHFGILLDLNRAYTSHCVKETGRWVNAPHL